MRRRYRDILLGFGWVLFAYLLFHLGTREILSLLLRIGWYFGVIAAIYVCHQLVRTLAWRECLIASSRPSYRDMVRMRFSGEAVQYLTFTGPFLSEPAKMWLLQRRGFSPKQAVAATFCEYLIYNLTSAAFAVIGLIWVRNHFVLSGLVSAGTTVTIYSMGAFLLAAAYAIVSRTYLIGTIITGLTKLQLIGRRMRFDNNDVRDTEDLLFAVLRDRPLRLLSVLAIELAAQGLLVLELFVILWAEGIGFSVARPILIEASAKFISLAFFFIPGQTGAAEAAYALIFKTIGLSASAGFTVAVVRRLRSLLVAGIGLATSSFGNVTPETG